MFHVFQEVQAGRYHMNATVNTSGQKQSSTGQHHLTSHLYPFLASTETDHDEVGSDQGEGERKKKPAMPFSRLNSTQLVASQGEVVESKDTIILESVPIITPNRDIVVSSLSFEVSTMLLHIR